MLTYTESVIKELHSSMRLLAEIVSRRIYTLLINKSCVTCFRALKKPQSKTSFVARRMDDLMIYCQSEVVR